MNKKIKLLFVCTGNVFRSMSAEYSLNNYVKKNNIKGIKASSAGITAKPESIHPTTLLRLKKHGINAYNHKQRKLNNKILKENDLIIAISNNHKEFIKSYFGKESFLFNEIYLEKPIPILDVNEAIKDWKTNKEAFDNHIIKTVDYIYNAIPDFVKNISKFI